MTYNLDLLYLHVPIFEVGVNTDKIAQVYIKTRTTHAYLGEMELDYITQQCTSLPEFEAELDRLVSELECIRQAARREFE